MKATSFPSATTCLKIFRMVIPIFLIIHGITRIKHGTVGDFGNFLNSQGFYIGFYLAWGITLFEIIGSILIMANYFTFWISIIFILELSTGIVLVHAGNGWFVVGGGTNGVEYSVLLILCYLLLATIAKASPKN